MANQAAPRLCACGARVPGGQRCRRCRQAADRARPADHYPFYGSAAWRRLRADVLREEPQCRRCGRASVEADHILPRRRWPALALVRENVQGLCRVCHGQKTRGEAP